MENMSILSWMAWTWPTAVFFICIALAIASMGVWEYFSPGGGPRHGIFGLDTTRGDRLFISLLGSAFIMLGWLGFVGPNLIGGVVVAVIWTFVVFKWV
jgi:predicted small integral membrane protein